MKEYYVYRYRYHDMKNARWGAKKTKYGVDCVPCSMLASPGLLIINASNKKEAIRLAKETYTQLAVISLRVPCKRTMYPANIST